MNKPCLKVAIRKHEQHNPISSSIAYIEGVESWMAEEGESSDIKIHPPVSATMAIRISCY
jgi:hypothetical protein